ncbi:SDR family oxidoreductase [Corynebacterium falsenii]|uniref:SDR family oxidoreductase n=1 Tax=Corynebacterium falsenii TaxID=108486 RepID=UPI001CCACD37|nr:SDR family NAD(P)-dependent oxidoreductase [Corynebacterium falsenii]UBI04072.1 SDR family oxidoreductase [Corynebacterium falsenii]
MDATMNAATDAATEPAMEPTMEPTPHSKVAVITGAGAGLGRAFARALATDGWTVAVLGRTEATLTETLELCDGSGHVSVTCDITDEAQVRDAFDRITGELGRLDVLINNAGIPGPKAPLHQVDLSAFDATMATNFRGAFVCSQAAFGWMAAHGGGRIINNGSIAGHAPRPHAAAYAASKAAMASLTTSIALDGREYNITATELDIGNARTELLANFTGTEPMFDADHAAQAVVTVANMPPEVSVDQLTITAAGMPYLGRG